MRTILASLLLVTACAGTGTYSATVSGPDLVQVEPGVQVVYDYDEPIFYADNYYWRNDGGHWYRSSYYNRGWVAYQPPARLRTIRQPERYRHYRPAGYQPKRSRPAPYRPAPSNSRPAPYRPTPSESRPAPYRPAPSTPAPYRPEPSDRRPAPHDNRDHDKHDKRDRRDHDKDDHKRD